ncbi:hypothetical protein ACFV6F_17720 [Kitasatospora phosalacinea]|uniref:hypothetical protein n=1 Tax=Kitasatospora phosalacinea TaxID=2065 RepID=UPI00365FC93E
MSTRLLRTDLRRLKPIREPRLLTEIPQRVWTGDEWGRIQLGFRARDMDDRWHIFAEDNQLFLHRSWLGDGKYEAAFAEVEGGYRIVRVLIEDAEPRFPGGSDQEVCLLLELLISSILLGERVDELHRKLAELRAATRPPQPGDN